MQIQQGEKFHAISKTHLATFFKQYAKCTKKNDFIKFIQVAHEIRLTKNAHKCGHFRVKSFIYQRNNMIVSGAAAIFSAIAMSDFTIATEIIRKRKMTRY